ncbi:MAG: ParB N-terminal domain-containing protein [Planctomycetes bacterium]|nr:ParB N-terminal domain-containing protein [Planctomycetota bacterium]
MASKPSGPNEKVDPVDVALSDLVPVRKRTASKVVFSRLEANIRAVGLIEPLLIYVHQGQRFIIDGYLRYKVLVSMGVEVVPCIIIDNLDLYTPNRQVNYLSRSQYRVMLERALTVVDEGRLTASLGLKRIRPGMNAALRAALAAEVVAAVDANRLTMSAAHHFVHVIPERQREIVALIAQAGDASGPFVRTQIMRTPPAGRTDPPLRGSPWARVSATRQKLVDRLVEAERRHDFFQGLYRGYASDLVKLAIYVRQLITCTPIVDALAKSHPEDLALFRKIVQQYGEQAVAG